MKLINSQKKAQQGFTLIELVVVIVILGILAVTAAPRFIDVSSDARQSVMEGVEGSIESAVSMINAKAIIQNQTGATGAVTVNGDFYAVVNGFPAALALGAGGADDEGLGITSLIDASAEITITNADPALFQHSEAGTIAECQLSYADAVDSDTRPVITSTFTDC
jgi:MSHA pilin protein MshA